MKTLNEYVDGLRLLMRQNKFDKVVGYSNFLKQPLQLWMFIPCDKDGNHMYKPVNYEWWKKRAINGTGEDGWRKDQVDSYLEYKQACDRVLFEGFIMDDGYFSCDVVRNDKITIIFYRDKEKEDAEFKTIEDLPGKVDLVEKVAKQFKY